MNAALDYLDLDALLMCVVITEKHKPSHPVNRSTDELKQKLVLLLGEQRPKTKCRLVCCNCNHVTMLDSMPTKQIPPCSECSQGCMHTITPLKDKTNE